MKLFNLIEWLKGLKVTSWLRLVVLLGFNQPILILNLFLQFYKKYDLNWNLRSLTNSSSCKNIMYIYKKVFVTGRLIALDFHANTLHAPIDRLHTDYHLMAGKLSLRTIFHYIYGFSSIKCGCCFCCCCNKIRCRTPTFKICYIFFYFTSVLLSLIYNLNFEFVYTNKRWIIKCRFLWSIVR